MLLKFFCGHDYQLNYNILHNKNGKTDKADLRCSIYDSTKIFARNKEWNRIKIINQTDIFSEILNRYKNSFRYNMVLTHKQKYENNE